MSGMKNNISPIIERAARALFRDDPGSWEGAIEEGLADGAWEQYIDSVNIVLRAIREHPSHAMLSAGGEAVYDQSGDTSVIEIWQAMIDAALVSDEGAA